LPSGSVGKVNYPSFRIRAFSGHFEMQSPHPRHSLGSTTVGSSILMRKIALIGHALTAEHSSHLIHFSGSIYAFGNLFTKDLGV
jgi:hypothetical protein